MQRERERSGASLIRDRHKYGFPAIPGLQRINAIKCTQIA
jgi:hypothetical protein